jgi:parallel beta-helix repeat protein
MDTGKGGCNNNLIYGNDFSHAPANGIEVTFSSNEIGNNQLEDCRYGIWGGYSWETTMTNNFIGDCEVGIAIEHGQDNTISRNTFYKDSVGIKLWERDQQPEDWGYAQHKDVSSRGYLVSRNWFQEVPTPLQVNNTKDLEHKSPLFAEKDAPEPTWGIGASPKATPLPDGIEAQLPSGHPRGRQFILVNEWGPYSFRYPSIWLRKIEGDRYNFLLLGPKQGNWKIVGGEGFQGVNQKTGTFPMTIIATKAPDAKEVSIELEFIGEACVDQFGREYGKGAGVRFSLSRQVDR